MYGPVALVADVRASGAGQGNLDALKRALANDGRPAARTLENAQGVVMKMLGRSARDDATFRKLHKAWLRYQEWHRRHGDTYFRPRKNGVHVSNLPNDVLGEISRHANHADLLRLGLTSKKVRGALGRRVNVRGPPASVREFVTPLVRAMRWLAEYRSADTYNAVNTKARAWGWDAHKQPRGGVRFMTWPVGVGGGPEHGGVNLYIYGNLTLRYLDIMAQLPGAPPRTVAQVLYGLRGARRVPRFDLYGHRLPRRMDGTPAARAWSVRWKAVHAAVTHAAGVLGVEVKELGRLDSEE